jgi:hypothetical protein
MNIESSTTWAILRTAPSQTLRLAASLTDAGFEAWSPVETIQRRAREGAKPEDVTVPLTPSFVFVRADRLMDLIELSHSPSLNYRVWGPEQRRMVTRGHPCFRLFRHLGEFALVRDSQLNPLRNIERKRKPKPVASEVPIGARVRLIDAGFEGLWGTVHRSGKSYTRVLIDGWLVPVDFPTWTLQAEACAQGSRNVCSSAQAPTAKAA